jgi:anti-sigma regulatory factor (Ser/Thr protein kinase)
MPAVLVGPEPGTIAMLTDAASVPLAVRRPQPRPQSSRVLPPGSTLMLFTDGLVERKHESIDDGIARAAAVLVKTTALPLDSVADAVLRELAPPAGYDDDVAMVVYRHHQSPLRIETEASAIMVPVHTSSAWNSPFVAGVPDESAADIVLVVNEACTNCVEHAYSGQRLGTMVLDAELAQGEIRARITDQGSWKTPAADPDNGGRGLLLMRALSSAVDLDPAPTGTTADITFRLPDGALPA